MRLKMVLGRKAGEEQKGGRKMTMGKEKSYEKCGG